MWTASDRAIDVPPAACASRGVSVVSHSPQVSCITIFLNEEQFLEQAIGSLFEQRFRNWELLLVDDGSTDRSSTIARSLACTYREKIRYLEHESHVNKGMSATRNLGIKHARGKYISFLDADDVWLPDKLDRQVQLLEANPDAVAVINPLTYWERDTQQIRPMYLPVGRLIPPLLIRAMLTSDDSVPHASSLIRRDTLEIVGGFDEQFRGPFEDNVVFSKIGLEYVTVFSRESGTLYRQHDASSTARVQAVDVVEIRIKYLKWLLVYLEARQCQSLQNEVAFSLDLTQLRWRVNRGDAEGAVSIIRSAESLRPRPEHGEWNYLAAFAVHTSGGNQEEALQRYNAALGQGFDEFWIRYNRGALRAARREAEFAVSDLKRAVELNPLHEGARELLKSLAG